MWSWISVLTLLASGGCRRSGGARSESLLVYCTPPTKLYAAALVHLAEEATGRPVILAPLRKGDLLSAVSGTRAGDFVLTLDQTLAAELVDLGLGEEPHDLGHVALCAVTSEATSLAELSRPGVRLGSGSPSGPLGRAAATALPADLRQAVDANVRHRSEHSGELIRLVRLGALDGALVWAALPAPQGLRSLAVPGAGSAGRLRVVQLTCSRQPARRLAAVHSAWSGNAGQRTLQSLGVRPQVGGRGT